MDKDHGIKLNEVVSRIRAVQAQRKEMKERQKFQEQVQDAVFALQSKGRMFRDSILTCASTSAGTPAPVVTFDTIQDAVDELAVGMSSKPKPKFLSLDDLMNGRQQSYSVGFEVKKDRDTAPIEWKLSADFNMNMISMVSDPEPGCEIKDPEFAFDYAMKLVEK